VPKDALTKTTNVKNNAPGNKEGHQNRAGLVALVTITEHPRPRNPKGRVCKLNNGWRWAH
jgi:hypothetical protein